jgi:hypothetical protein
MEKKINKTYCVKGREKLPKYILKKTEKKINLHENKSDLIDL